MSFDVVIVGGGPGGLSAALALGRARKRVLLCDAGPRRNAAAAEVHNFVTRDGTPPTEFRQIGREQLRTYPRVEVRDAPAVAVEGVRGAFRVRVGDEVVQARRVLLATGMIDELPAIDGFRELWGHSIYQCPYCHGWEAQDTTWGYLVHDATAPHLVMFLLMLRAWTRDVVVFTGHAALPAEVQARLTAAGVRVQPGEVTRVSGEAQQLTHVELADGTRVPCAALFAHPPQRQVPLVHALGLALDADGFVKVDPMTRETSVPGIYASGDLTSRMQSALAAAAAGQLAGSMLNMELTIELAEGGQL